RALLDELGATDCQIMVSGDLDEHRVSELADAPIDRYLFGTRLVTGSGAPTAELVYKLVAVADRPDADAPQKPVAKTSEGKGHRGGRKVATRVIDEHGTMVTERVLSPTDEAPPVAPEHIERGLQVPWMIDGDVIRPFSPDAARAHHTMARAELPPDARRFEPGRAAFVAEPSGSGTTPPEEVTS
ncbi:MAG: nicotinate phosphoribosyltransferase, partial [Aquihabitans sp.]